MRVRWWAVGWGKGLCLEWGSGLREVEGWAATRGEGRRVVGKGQGDMRARS